MIFLLFFSLSSCNKELLDDTTSGIGQNPSLVNPNSDIEVVEIEEQEIILGAKLPNPFNINIMIQAAYFVNSELVILPNNYYVRFLPSCVEQLNELIETEELNIYDYPLDYDITQEGAFYQDPSIPIEEITWQYTVVPINYSFNNGIQYEILDTLYLPDETNEGYEIEDKAFSICGLDAKSGGDKGIRKNPEGDITVENTSTGSPEGVKGVKVYVRNWFKIGSTFTDNAGHFTISNKKFKKAKVTVAFQNQYSQIRTIRGIRVWRVYYCSRIFLNDYEKYVGSELETISHTISKNTDISTRAARDWSAATTNNAIQDMRTLCQQEGLPTPPLHLSIYLNNWTNMGSAPMFKIAANSTLLNDFISVCLLPTGHPNSLVVLTNLVLQQFLPDLTIGYKNDAESTKDLYEQIFHELSHSMHYAQVGSNWWENLIRYETIYHSSDYCAVGDYDYERCALAESWAFFSEEYFSYLQFNSTNIHTLDRLEKFPTDYSWEFIPRGLPLDLMDNSDFWQGATSLENEDIVDNMDGISISEYFGLLTAIRTSPTDVKDALIINHPLREEDINNLFNSYGY